MGGKSGYLPDISGEFKYFKTYALNELRQRNYNGVYSGLMNLNRCLGDEYKVTISTSLYEKQSSLSAVYLCNFCTKEEKKIINKGEEDEHTELVEVPTRIPIDKVTIENEILSLIDSIFERNETRKVWVCPECEKTNLVSETDKIVPERTKPYSLVVVPDCPMKLNGLANRKTFDREFERWANLFLEEITSQEVLYRTEWKAQNEGDEMIAYKDKGDEE